MARRNMSLLVIASKHINNTWDIAGQLLDKWVPAAMDTHTMVKVLLNYNNGNSVLYVVRAKML
jgi:hypothetical protein